MHPAFPGINQNVHFPLQPKPRARVIDDLLKYVHTDAACVRYEPGPLATRQAQVGAWSRVHASVPEQC